MDIKDYPDYRKLIPLAIPNALVKEAVELIRLNDVGHNLDHCYFVVRRCIRLVEHQRLDSKQSLQAITGALMHDIGCSVDRDTHHIVGAKMSRELLSRYSLFDAKDIDVISGAVLRHRASFKGARMNRVEEIVAVADRGGFDVETEIRRALQYQYKLSASMSDGMVDSLIHLIDKYGYEGYGWVTYPSIGFDYYRGQITTFQQVLYDGQGYHRLAERIAKTIWSD